VTSSALLLISAVALLSQQGDRANRIVALSLVGDTDLTAEVLSYPDAAREAFGELLRLAVVRDDSRPVGDPLRAADALGAAYFNAWTDPFYGQEAGRFRSWSPNQRRIHLTADSLRQAGNEAFTAEGITAAASMWRRSLRLGQTIPDYTGVARALGNLGAGYYAAGDLDSASVYLSQAYDRAVAVGDLRTAASALTNLASINYERGEYPQAAVLYGNSLDLLERTGDARFQSANRHNLALVAMALGDLQGAREALVESIRISRLHGYPEDEAQGLSSLADVALVEGSFAEAESALRASLELSRSTDNRIAEAGALHSRGILQVARGAYREAERDLGQALAIYERLGMAANVVEVRTDRATVLGVMGQVAAGLDQLQTADRLVESAGLGPLLAADVMLATADLSALLNDYERAAAAYDQAGRLYRAASDIRGEASADRGRGLMELTRENWSAAVDRLSQAWTAEKSGGSVRSHAVSGMYLAYALDKGGDADAARNVLRTAQDELTATADPVAMAAVLGMQADIEAANGMLVRADSLYRTALATLGDRQVPDVAWRLHAGLADVLLARGQPAAAEHQLERSVVAIERGAAGAPFNQRSAYLRDKWQAYAQLAALQAARGDAAEFFATSERLRAGRTLATLAGGRTADPSGDPSALRTQEQDLRRRMITLSAQLYASAGAATALREPAVTLSTPDLGSALRSTQEEYSRVLDLIRREDEEYAETIAPAIPDLDDLRSRLADNEAFVEYLMTDSATLAVVVTSEASRVLNLDIGRESVADLISFARAAIERGRTGSEVGLWIAPLRRLYSELMQPIETEGLLDGKTHLTIVPHAELHYLPFQALITAPDRIEFMVERFAIGYAPSAAVWVRLSDRPAGDTSGLLAMAPRAADLPGSAYEVRAVAEYLGDDAHMLVGGEATEQAFRDASGSHRVLHLATYGSLNRSNPLFSWLDLAPGGSDDGRLEVHEVYGLDLHARLVVLSACETALGAGAQTNSPAGDDWVGLTRAFLTAGADNVVASLWRVEDLATAELMRRFYRELGDGASFSDALTIAQRALLHDPDTAHPFYWAGFSLVGETRGSL
jgi:CHAT domain-containing protein